MAYEIGMKTAFPIALEQPCSECDGKGSEVDDMTGLRYVCDVCDGTGHVLTDAGQQVFAFIEHAIQRVQFRSSGGFSI